MKRSIFIAVLGMGSMAAAYGQGLVNFANYYSGAQTTGITYANGPNVGKGVGSEISVELLYGLSTVTDATLLTALAYSDASGNISPVPAGNNNGVGPGFITGNAGTATGAGWFNGGTLTVPTIGATGPGGTYAFALYAFGGNYVGYSPVFTGTTSASSTAPTPDLPLGLGHGSFTVSAVPEPTTLALAGLGGLASLVALRRKQS
jgi:hypothetical protein